MNIKFSRKLAYMAAFILDIGFLAAHLFLFAFFAHLGVTFMMYVNIASIAVYIVGIVLLRMGKNLQMCVLMFFIEVLVHMYLAIMCVGWDCGFQLCLIGMVVLLFFSDYFSFKLGERYIRGMGFSFVSLIAYVVAYLDPRSGNPYYVVDEKVAYFTHLVISVVVFLLCIFYLWMLVQITCHSEMQLSMQAQRDELTDLPNRSYMMKCLQRLSEEKRCEGTWVAMVDVDDFKQINDTYGHNCGDYVLCEIAKMLQSCCENDTICRWGGEEFLVSGLQKQGEDYRTGLQGLCDQVAAYSFQYENVTFHVTLTIGAALYKEEYSLEQWIDCADKNLYVGKYNGKNRLIT